MPSKERVEALISLVEQDKFVEALQEFYAEEATTQENNDPPRVGLANLIEVERQVLARLKVMHTNPVEWFIVQGDRAVIKWVFDFIDPAGRSFRLEELASQLWRGDKIVEEHFYFDPAQKKRPL